MSEAPEARDRKLGVILLGACHFENYPPEFSNPAFLTSTRTFQKILSDPTASIFRDNIAVLDLFDSSDEPRELFTRIRDFLRGESDLSDVLVYYCGHGCFLRDRTYLLLLRATDPDMAEFTGLLPRFMRNQLERHLAAKRLFLILDCCFAGRAAQEWMSDTAHPLVMEQFRDAFPVRGAVLAVAASKQSVAVAPEGEAMTMFTGAILETLAEGLHDADRSVSFRQVIEAVRRRILFRYGSEGVAPELHSPMQDQGDIADMPFFYNPAYQPRTNPGLRRHIDESLTAFDHVLTEVRRSAVRALAEVPVDQVDVELRRAVATKLVTVAESDDSFGVRTSAATELARWRVSGEERNPAAMPGDEATAIPDVPPQPSMVEVATLSEAEARWREFKLDQSEDVELIQAWLTQYGARAPILARIGQKRATEISERRRREDGEDWTAAAAENTLSGYRRYLAKWPGGTHANEANETRSALERDKAWRKGREAYDCRDYQEAMRWYRDAADRGDPNAQNDMGNLFREGWGVERDYNEAMRCYRKAADQGHAGGQSNIGWLYQNGWSVAQDYREAMRWYIKAAQQGHGDAQNNIGWLYRSGLGVARDYNEAMRWYRKAADRGHAVAQNNIGVLYQNGVGVARDYEEAMRWYRQAAVQGNAQAQYSVGFFYANGWGVRRDLNEARVWMQKAADAGLELAKKWLEANQ